MRRKKLRSLKSLRRELDSAFSKWIRKRDADEEGLGSCVSCGRWRELQCGHFVKRGHTAIRWDERNAHGQCAGCNIEGDNIQYTLYMQKRYGQSVVDELLAAKRKTVKMTRADYEQLLEKYL